MPWFRLSLHNTRVSKENTERKIVKINFKATSWRSILKINFEFTDAIRLWYGVLSSCLQPLLGSISSYSPYGLVGRTWSSPLFKVFYFLIKRLTDNLDSSANHCLPQRMAYVLRLSQSLKAQHLTTNLFQKLSLKNRELLEQRNLSKRLLDQFDENEPRLANFMLKLASKKWSRTALNSCNKIPFRLWSINWDCCVVNGNHVLRPWSTKK